jgi:alpha-glucosidase
MDGPADPWGVTVYEVYVRSFADGSGDGVGDLAGLCERLPYLASLSIDYIWLTPFYKSPLSDLGYDVSDYYDVAPEYGSVSAFRRLATLASEVGIRVLVDFVGNHTSSTHPWFRDASSSELGSKADWYIWRSRPNNWGSAIVPGSAWSYVGDIGKWYLHSFLPSQPGLNWANPSVRAEMMRVVSFWINNGADGVRVDAAHLLGKDGAFPDIPAKEPDKRIAAVNNQPVTHSYLAEFSGAVRAAKPGPLTIGEVFYPEARRLGEYYGTQARPELDVVLSMAAIRSGLTASLWLTAINEAVRWLQDEEHSPSWVLGSHDVSRLRSRAKSEAAARLVAFICMFLPGTFVLFQGDELGLEDAAVPPETRIDPMAGTGSGVLSRGKCQ